MPSNLNLKAGLAAFATIASFAVPATAQAAPDLVPKINSISPQPSPPNSSIVVRTAIANDGRDIADLNQRGPGGVAVHMVRWHLRERGGSERFLLAMSMLGKLPGGAEKALNASMRIPATTRPGRHEICVTVDPANAIRERNEGNNRTCSPITVSGGSPGLAARPGVKLPDKPRIIGPGAKAPIKPGVAQRQCVNPAIVELQVGIIRRDPRNRFQGTIQLKAVLKNVGNADYITGPNQQSVQLFNGRSMLKNESFGNLRRGEVKIISAQLPWNAAGEFQEDLKAHIVYDPDILLDGNPNNDDCNMRDNSKSVSPATANRLFTG